MILTQTDMVYNHMKTKGPITPLEALNLYGIFRLGARAWDLKKQGIPIKTEIIKHNGKHFARYSLEESVNYVEEKNGQKAFV